MVTGAGKANGATPDGAKADRPTLDVPALETWLWAAACTIRGPVDAPKFKDYILPLVFLKRLSDVFDDEVVALAEQFEDAELAGQLVDEDHRLVRLYVPPEARWPAIAERTTGIGEYLTDAARAVARDNPRLQGVVDVIDFNATTQGQRIVSDSALAGLVQVLNQHRLGLRDVEPDILGRAYEYLLRKFAEGQGQSAGEFYTPREVGVLMARLLGPEPGMTAYDPCCGSGGLLIKCHLRLLETHGDGRDGHRELPAGVAPLRVFGQEINGVTFALARMNAFLHDMQAEIRVGDTLERPAFTDGAGRLRGFDLVATNPMWNQKFAEAKFEQDPYDRFGFGAPPRASADWGWLQQVLASLGERGRAAVVLDTGALSRGSGNQGANRERELRTDFLDKDAIEAVVLLPDNLFYNTSAPGIVVVLNRAKRRPGEILLVNATALHAKGRPKNYLTDVHVEQVAALYREWRAAPGLSAVIRREEARANDDNLSPSRYVAGAQADDVLPLEDAVVLLQEAEEERATADEALDAVLAELGLGSSRATV